MEKTTTGRTLSKSEIKGYIAKENPTPPTADKRVISNKSRPPGEVKSLESQLPHPDEGVFLGKSRPKLECDFSRTPKGEIPPGIGDLASAVPDVDPPDPISDYEVEVHNSRIDGLKRFRDDYPEEEDVVNFKLAELEDDLAQLLIIKFNRFPPHWLPEVEPMFVRAGLSALQRKIVYLTLVGKDQKSIKNNVKTSQSAVTRNKKAAYHKLRMCSVSSGGEGLVWFTILRVLNTKGRYVSIPTKPLGETVSRPRRYKPRGEKQKPRKRPDSVWDIDIAFNDQSYLDLLKQFGEPSQPCVGRIAGPKVTFGPRELQKIVDWNKIWGIKQPGWAYKGKFIKHN